jgi:hypothetical protein
VLFVGSRPIGASACNTLQWREPASYQVIDQLIAATITKTGLAVHCELDTAPSSSGIVASDDELAGLNLTPAEFHGE